MNWDKLSLRDKAELMRIYLNSGISSLSSMRDHYNKYAEGGYTEDTTTSSRGNLLQRGGNKTSGESEINPLIKVIDKWNNVSINSSPKDEDLIEDIAIKDVLRRLMDVENNKKNPNSGWDEKNKRWYPHDSSEGGEKTIGYGFKLNKHTQGRKDPWQTKVEEQGYLTDSQAIQAADSMARLFYRSTKDTYDNRVGKGKFSLLSPKTRSFLTDYAYTGSLKKFKNLMDATASGDLHRMKQESSRTYTDKKGRTHPTKQRNDYMLRELDSLNNSPYSIFK